MHRGSNFLLVSFRAYRDGDWNKEGASCSGKQNPMTRIQLPVIALVVAVICVCLGYYFWGPCGVRKVANTTAQLQAILTRWDDQNKLASQTSRIALAMPVSELQKMRRETEALMVPTCLKNAKTNLTNAMNSTIDGYLAFMGSSDDTTAGLKIQEASLSLERFRSEIDSTNSCAPFCSGLSTITVSKSDEHEKAKRTLADMRIIGTVVETYAVDNNEYPPAKDIVDLKSYVEPKYIAALPQFDSWEKNFLYIVGADKYSYSIISGGSDGQFNNGTWVAHGAFEDLSEDIVFSAGEFKRYPRNISP